MRVLKSGWFHKFGVIRSRSMKTIIAAAPRAKVVRELLAGPWRMEKGARTRGVPVFPGKPSADPFPSGERSIQQFGPSMMWNGRVNTRKSGPEILDHTTLSYLLVNSYVQCHAVLGS